MREVAAVTTADAAAAAEQQALGWRVITADAPSRCHHRRRQCGGRC